MSNQTNKPACRLCSPAGLALAVTVALAGCGSSTTPAGDASGTGGAPWTTLGTRALTSQPGTSITSNSGAQWVDYNPAVLYPKTVEQSLQYIAMPDGIKLATYLTLPADASGKAVPGAFPTILIQTPYNGGTLGQLLQEEGGADPYMVEHGYATLVVDVRGTGQSEGSWELFGPDEQSDYGNVVNWVTQQSWSNGSIGVFGASYLGTTALFTAAQDHAAVKAAFAGVPEGDTYRDIFFTGGQVDPTFVPIILSLISVAGLIDPVLLTDPSIGIQVILDHLASALLDFQVPDFLKAVLGDPTIAYDSSFWGSRSALESDAKVNVPTFVVGGLHCIFQRSEPLTYETLKTRVPAKLLIGPWTHIQAELGTGLPVDGVPVLDHIELQWFDQYVKGMAVGADQLPNVTQYVSGYGHYVTATDWPNPQVQAQKLYLHGDKSLSDSVPVPGEMANQIVQEPIEGLCSISISQWTGGLLGLIPLPCFSNDNLTELLDVKYQTAPMAEDTVINGPIEADVWMSTTAADAGLSVRVDDVDASGNAVALSDGLQTASLRAVDATRSRTMNGLMITPWHPYTQASVQALVANTPVLVPVEIFPTSAMIAKGHSLRVAVGASDLPQGVPPLPTLLQSLVGVITVYTDAAHPSSVVIPVVPASALGGG